MAKAKTTEKAVADFSAAVAKGLDGELKVALPYLEILNVVVLIVQTLAKFCAEKTAAKLAAKIAKAKNPKKGEKLRAHLRAKVLVECQDWGDDDIDCVCEMLIERASDKTHAANLAVFGVSA